MPRFFNALTGRELIELIISDLRKTLEEDDYFDQATVFPILKYEFGIKIEAYPVAQPVKEVFIKDSLKDDTKDADGNKPLMLNKKKKREVDVPDLARESIGNTILVPADIGVANSGPNRNEIR